MGSGYSLETKVYETSPPLPKRSDDQVSYQVNRGLDSSLVVLRFDKKTSTVHVFVDGKYLLKFNPQNQSKIFLDEELLLLIEKEGESWFTDPIITFRLLRNQNEINQQISNKLNVKLISFQVIKRPKILLYEIQIEYNNKIFKVTRRFRDFRLLNDFLLSYKHHVCEIILKERVNRQSFMDIDFIEKRRVNLQDYTLHLLGLPNFSQNPDVLAFFGIVPSLSDVKPFTSFEIEQPPLSAAEEHCFRNEFKTVSVSKAKEVCDGPLRLSLELLLELCSNNLKLTLQDILNERDIDALIRGYQKMNGEDKFNRVQFEKWYESEIPLLSTLFKFRLEQVFAFPTSSSKEFPPKFDLPSNILTNPMTKYLCLTFSECYSCLTWNRLFASSANGLSFQTLETSLEGYDGPTILLIKDRQNQIFGALTTGKWKEDVAFYSSLGGGLFSLSPIYKVYQRKMTSSNVKSKNVQYMNARSKTLPLGIGFGGELHSKTNASITNNKPRLWIDSEFENNFVTLGNNDLVFESGPLLEDGLFRESFQISEIEAWGLGGKDALQARELWQNQKNKMIQNQKKVDKSQFANNAFDREYLLGDTFSGYKGKELNN